jgi:ABC-2 type transport system ATP-binding protein
MIPGAAITIQRFPDGRPICPKTLRMTEPLVDVQDFHKAYRGLVAVNGLSFQVMPGEVLGLCGPNGAGKTTTLRTIAGVFPPTQGSIHVAGFDIATQAVDAKRNLAYVPDDPKLFDMLTVREHLEFVANCYGLVDWEPRVQPLLEEFELWEKRNATAGELSRGMRQKVAICCAYLHDPKLIMFDEPHTGLDPRGIRTMKQSVKQRAADGAAVIVSSHLLNLVEDLCTHLLILNRGQLLYFGRLQGCRAAFADVHQDASLEEVFLHATEGPGANR